MSEQGKFLEELEAVKSIAASQDNKLAKDEVKKYLSDLKSSWYNEKGLLLSFPCRNRG